MFVIFIRLQSYIGCLFQGTFGKRGNNIILIDIKKECSKYEEGLTKASQSNHELHRAMNLHITNLRLLSGPLDELESALPSVVLRMSEYRLYNIMLM